MSIRKLRDPRLTGQDTSGTNVLQQSGVQEGQDNVTSEENIPGQEVVTSQAMTQSAPEQSQTQQTTPTNTGAQAAKAPARSGMFTNIKSLIEKNKPVVQQMGKRAGEQFSSTAEKVRQQAEQRANIYQQNLAQTEKDIQSQLTAGRKAVDVAAGITSPPPSQQTKDTEQDTTLAEYGQRAQEALAGISALNLEEQAREASRLQQQASGILSDTGRKELLRDVFGRGRRQYSTGAQALDTLLLSQSPEAGEQLTQTIGQAAKGLGDISRQQQAAQSRLQAAKDLSGRVAEDLEKYGISKLSGVESDIQQVYDDFVKRRNLQLEGQYGNVIDALSSRQKEILSGLGVGEQGLSDDFSENLQKVAQFFTGGEGSLWDRGEAVFGEIAKGQYEGQDLSELDQNTQLARVNEDRLKEKIKNRLSNEFGFDTQSPILNNLADSFIKDMWAGSSSSRSAKEDQYFKASSLVNAYKNLVKSYSDLDFETMLKDKIAAETGKSYDDLISAKDIDMYDVADTAEIEKFNRLKKLLGQKDIVTPESLSENVVDSNLIRDILDQYKYGTRSGGRVSPIKI